LTGLFDSHASALKRDGHVMMGIAISLMIMITINAPELMVPRIILMTFGLGFQFFHMKRAKKFLEEIKKLNDTHDQ
jgi:hypothetical protein